MFIKPLPGPTAAFAQDFLERIAAISHPIMKAHHLSIMSLEEYEPNPEFVGRNFNAGEVVQLVLRSPRSGHWLGFRQVQMVMMHELAHCQQMNHSGAFWKVRNLFAEDLRALWGRGYTGDGFWGRGKTLLSGQYEPVIGLQPEIIPRSLCGGTYRSSRGRKRKRKGATEGAEGRSSVTYAERQQRRIAKKFGTNGVTLGDDTETRIKLEDGKKPKGKPRVAGSARGRELRAAAALARFGSQKEKAKEEEEQDVKKEASDSDNESESDYDDGDVLPSAESTDLRNGARLLDGKGNRLIKVCEDEDQNDAHVKQEMNELNHLDDIPTHAPTNPKIPDKVTTHSKNPDKAPSHSSNIHYHPPFHSPNPGTLSSSSSSSSSSSCNPKPSSTPHPHPQISCPVCTLCNPPNALRCAACAHVLQPDIIGGKLAL